MSHGVAFGSPATRCASSFGDHAHTRDDNFASPTAEVGMDFMRSVGRDIKTLQLEMRESLQQMSAAVQAETRNRERAVGLSQDRIAELKSKLDAEIAARELHCSRAEELEQRVKSWVCALGAGGKATKERLAVVETACGDAARGLADAHSRITGVEQQLPSRATLSQLDEMAVKVGGMHADIERTATDLILMTGKLEEMKRTSEASARALSSSVTSINGEMQSHARVSDLTALELRVSAQQHSLQICTEEVAKRAATADLELLADKVANLTVHSRAANVASAESLSGLQAGLTSVEANIEHHVARLKQDDTELRTRTCELVDRVEGLRQSANSAAAKLDRRIDLEREKLLATHSALDQELSKNREEIHAIEPRLSSLELEARQLSSAVRTKAEESDVHRVKSRMDKVEAELPAKADAEDLAKFGREVSDQKDRQIALTKRTFDAEERVVLLDNDHREHKTTMEVMQCEARDLDAKLNRKANQSEVHSKVALKDVLADYYSKHEIDAFLTRVWWRVGDLKSAPKTVAAAAGIKGSYA